MSQLNEVLVLTEPPLSPTSYFQTCRPDGGASGGAGHDRVHRFRCCVHPSLEDPCRHVHPDVSLLCRVVRQNPSGIIFPLILTYKQSFDTFIPEKALLTSSFWQGKTIPINQARPNRNLTFTKKEPLG